MKNMKKVFALVLVLVMVLALSATAFAQTVGTAAAGTGSITVKNASRGDTYKLFKLFDATVTNVPATGDADGIAYTGEIPTALAAYFTKDLAGNIHIAKHGEPGAEVEWTQAEIISAVQAWAATLPETDPHFVTKATSDGSVLTFQGLPYGYYAVTTTLGTIVTIDSTKPNAQIIDKNSKEPSVDKIVDGTEYNIGDTITYTAVFDAPNYLPSETPGGDPEQVTSYVIKDTLPSFLSDVVITSVQIGKFDADNNYAPIGELQADLSSSYTAFDSNKQIEIKWVTDETVPNATHTYTSAYTSNSQIKITYTAKLNANAGLAINNKNKVSLVPKVDKGNGPEPYSETDKWNDDVSVKTYGTALKKVDENGNALPGAEFQIAGLVVTGDNGLYTVVSYDPTGATAGTVMKTDANGLLRIGGLKSGQSLSVTETKAPDGYNKIANPFTVTTTVLSEETTSTSGSVTRYYDAQGNLVDTVEEASSTVTTIEYTSIDNLPASAITQVENKKGTELPETGGIGTTIFFVVGGLLMAAAVVLLITKKRVGNAK